MENSENALIVKKINLDKDCRLSNKIIEARYKLNPMEQNLFYIILSQIDKNAEKLPDYITLNVNQLADTFNLGTDKYTKIKKLTQSFQKKPIELKKENGSWESHILFPSIYYKPKNKENDIVIFFNKSKSKELEIDIEKEILKVRKAYEDENVEFLISFKTKYASRFYMLIKQYKKIGERELKLNDLIEFLHLNKMYGTRITNIRERIIEPALNEVKEKGKISFDYEYIKEGKKYIAIRFSNIKMVGEEKNITPKEEDNPAFVEPPKEEELSQEQEKYLRKLYYDIKIKPISVCEKLVRSNSIEAITYVCAIWSASQESESKLNAGYVRGMLESGKAEEELKRMKDIMKPFMAAKSQAEEPKKVIPKKLTIDDVLFRNYEIDRIKEQRPTRDDKTQWMTMTEEKLNLIGKSLWNDDGSFNEDILDFFKNLPDEYRKKDDE